MPYLQKRYLPNPLPTEAENIAQLVPLLKEQLEQREQLALYKELELPLAPVLARMEYNGITPDMELLDQLNEDMSFRIGKLERLAGSLLWASTGSSRRQASRRL